MVTGGDHIGTVYENSLFKQHKILVPPKIRGRIKRIHSAGQYNVRETILELENELDPSKP